MAGGQPHRVEDKCESSGQELDLDADSINMLLTTVGYSELAHLCIIHVHVPSTLVLYVHVHVLLYTKPKFILIALYG